MIEYFRKHIAIALAVSLACFSLILYFYVLYTSASQPIAAVDPFVVALQTIMAGICVALILDIVDKFSRRESLSQKISALRESTENALQLKFGYGFGGVSDDPSELENIENMPQGSVRWLNTLFRNAEINMKAVNKAVYRGIDVQLLMMHPLSNYAEVRGRYTALDYEDENSIYQSIKAYQQNLHTSFEYICMYYDKLIKDKEQEGSIGSLKIRFYEDPAGLPILLLDSNDVVEAYSGFYINSVSSKLPYVTWTEKIGGKPFINDLADYFERKWHFCEGNSVDVVRKAYEDAYPGRLDRT